jgi:hypothetical protein
MSLFGDVQPENERAKALGHSGIRVGEIIAYRAWRVGQQGCLQPRRDRLCSIYMSPPAATCGHTGFTLSEPWSAQARSTGGTLSRTHFLCSGK